MAKKTNDIIQLQRPDLRIIAIPITGTAGLIMHKWSEKAKKEMLDKQMKKAKQGRDAKDPQKDYEDSIYYTADGKFGFPAIGFKAAIVRAGTYSGMPMTFLRGALHINGEFVEIHGLPTMREDMVRVGMGTADIRYRAEFKQWSAVLHIRYNAGVISEEQIANLVLTAGFSVGVGEWRPEKDGQFGTWDIDEANTSVASEK